jgi:hypothetical protein
MAIVFISPKGKQRLFFTGMAMLSIAVFMVVGLFILIPDFFGRNKYTPTKRALTEADIATVNINFKFDFSIMDSAKVKNLKLFDQIETSFAYVVVDQQGKQIIGNVSAVDQGNAQKALESNGYKVVEIKEANIGRNNPFVSY